MRSYGIRAFTEKDLNPGDHIYVKRNGLFYSHHGIYAGDGKVIHYKGTEKEKKDPVIRETDMDEFLNGGRLKKRYYKNRLPHPETLRLATEHLSNKGYSLVFNNCEHFATFCATGKKKSRQVEKVVGSIAGIAFAVTAAFIRRKNGKNLFF